MAKKQLTNVRENPEQALLDRYVDEIASATPLTPEEEQHVCQQIAMGNRQALDRLVEVHLPMVVAIARRHVAEGVSLLDLINEGNIGLIRAAQKFDSSRGQRFAQYAVHDVKRAIVDFLPPEVPKIKHATDGLASDSVADDIIGTNAYAEGMALKIDLLPEREQMVLRHIYGIGTEPITMQEIADRNGLKRERVRQIRNKALRHLRNLRNL